MPEAGGIIQALGIALLHFLWQGLVIGCAAAIALRLLRDASPQARYAAACLALATCVLVPATGLIASLLPAGALPASGMAGAAGGIADASRLAPGTAVPAWLPDWLPAIVAAWAAGACALCLRMAVGLHWIHALRASPQPPSTATWQRRLDRIAGAFGLSRAVVLRLVDRLETPASAGWLRPVVLLPTAVAARLPVELVEALLAHELAHVRRHDYLVNLLQSLAEALLFFHPVTWWLSHQVRLEREQVADALAARTIGDPRRLARALAALSALQADARAGCATPHPHLAQAAHGGQLMSRIQSLVQPGRPIAGRPVVLPLAGLLMAALALYAHAQAPSAPARAASTTPASTTPAAIEAPAVARQALPAATPAAVPAPAVSQGPVLPSPRPAPSAAIGHMQAINDGHRDELRFEHEGRDYVIDDPATVARARAAWTDFEAFAPRMEALAREMAAHGERMAAIDARKAEAHARASAPRVHEAAARLATLAAEQQQLAARHLQAVSRIPVATPADRAALEATLAALDAEMEALDARMELGNDAIEAQARALEASLAPLEALGEQMALASAPMEEIGARMEAIGREQEAHARAAETRMRAVIADAMALGLARPAQGNADH